MRFVGLNVSLVVVRCWLLSSAFVCGFLFVVVICSWSFLVHCSLFDVRCMLCLVGWCCFVVGCGRLLFVVRSVPCVVVCCVLLVGVGC